MARGRAGSQPAPAITSLAAATSGRNARSVHFCWGRIWCSIFVVAIETPEREERVAGHKRDRYVIGTFSPGFIYCRKKKCFHPRGFGGLGRMKPRAAARSPWGGDGLPSPAQRREVLPQRRSPSAFRGCPPRPPGSPPRFLLRRPPRFLALYLPLPEGFVKSSQGGNK